MQVNGVVKLLDGRFLLYIGHTIRKGIAVKRSSVWNGSYADGEFCFLIELIDDIGGVGECRFREWLRQGIQCRFPDVNAVSLAVAQLHL